LEIRVVDTRQQVLCKIQLEAKELLSPPKGYAYGITKHQAAFAVTTRYLSTRSDIESFAQLLFTEKYTRSMGRIDPDYDEILLSGDAYTLLSSHIRSNSVWNIEAQIPIRAVKGMINPLAAVFGIVKDIAQAVIGDVISPPSALTKGCRCIGSYYRSVQADDGSTLRASWSPFHIR
jgi:hypothetical protein